MVSLGWMEGKNPRRKFNTKDEAQAFCLQEKTRRKAHGLLTAEADGGLVSRWIKLEQQLKANGIGSLAEVAERALRDHSAITKRGSAKECLNAALKALKALKADGIAGSYHSDLKNRCGRFLRWFGANRPMSEATPQVVSTFFGSINDKSGSCRRTISAWMGWATDNGLLPLNPCLRKRRRGKKSGTKGRATFLSPEESAKILSAAVRSESWDVLSFLALSMFAGIRPQEFRKRAKGFAPLDLRWEDIHEEHVAINEVMAKTGRGRLIEIPPVLKRFAYLAR